MRQILFFLPLLLPMALWLAYIFAVRQKAIREGRELPDYLESRTTFWLLLAGVVLAGGILFFWVMNSGAEPGSSYRPPEFRDGEIVPGEFR